MSTTPGALALVLHSHLPWVAHHGRWPVGEEWLHQVWTASYLPLTRLLRELADEGRQDVLTLGVTPVLADQLDDAGCLRAVGTWAGGWQARAAELADRREPHLRALAGLEFRTATAALDDLATHWAAGGSPVLRALAEAGVVELLDGPATHPFLPLLDPRVASFALQAGLDDGRRRRGSTTGGAWLPECGWTPSLTPVLAGAGVTHFLADEATLAAAGRESAGAWRIRGANVVVFGRDLAVTDRIWSSRTGYPAGAHYRDFHTADRACGLRPLRVTGTAVDPAGKQPYDPARAALDVQRDAVDFVTRVRDRLAEVAARDGRPGLVVAAYDTELFGHWWHEGPAFLARVLRLLPEAGVRLTTLSGALGGALPGQVVRGPIDLPAGSWGAGKDFRVWDGPVVRPLVDEAFWVQRRLLDIVDGERRAGRLDLRRPDLDQLARQALLTLSSDWAFMVTRDQAADYALRREAAHRSAFHELAALVERADVRVPHVVAAQREVDGPFAALDARTLAAQAP